eukprot:COSAG04_NODE_2337_length_4306_cov_17.637271_6_plen_162_part_00
MAAHWLFSTRIAANAMPSRSFAKTMFEFACEMSIFTCSKQTLLSQCKHSPFLYQTKACQTNHGRGAHERPSRAAVVDLVRLPPGIRERRDRRAGAPAAGAGADAEEKVSAVAADVSELVACERGPGAVAGGESRRREAIRSHVTANSHCATQTRLRVESGI